MGKADNLDGGLSAIAQSHRLHLGSVESAVGGAELVLLGNLNSCIFVFCGGDLGRDPRQLIPRVALQRRYRRLRLRSLRLLLRFRGRSGHVLLRRLLGGFRSRRFGTRRRFLRRASGQCQEGRHGDRRSYTRESRQSLLDPLRKFHPNHAYRSFIQHCHYVVSSDGSDASSVSHSPLRLPTSSLSLMTRKTTKAASTNAGNDRLLAHSRSTVKH